MGKGLAKDALAAIDSLYIRCKFKSKKLSIQQPKAALKLGNFVPD